MRGGSGGQGERQSPGGKDIQDSGHHTDSEEEEDEGHREPTPHHHPERPDAAEDSIVLESSYPPAGDYVDEEEEEEDALEVVVETLLGDSYRVRVSQWDTAAVLKGLLHRTLGIPMNHQHLIFGPHELLDEVCLMEQGVVDGSTLRLVLAMRGGPINARRLPTHEDMLWREVTDYIDVNKEDLWEGVGGRTVTLLVLRDGDNVNLYRVVENQDGSFSPLNESWASTGSGGQTDRAANQTAEVIEEEAKTRARMAEIRARMTELRIRNKARREKGKISSSAQRSLSRGSKTGSEQREELSTPRLDLSQGFERLAGRGSRPNTQQRSAGKRVPTGNPWAGRRSRPTTQERSEFPHTSISRPTLEELPNAHPRVPIDFSRRKPLDNIRPQGDRARLASVDEGQGKHYMPLELPDTSSTQVQNKNYDSYRKTIMRHVNSGSRENQDGSGGDKRTPEAWPRRDISKPLYMLPETVSRSRRYDGDRLNHSHNQELMRAAKSNANNRPKTSPEVLERRPGTSGDQSTISERIHLRAPDDRLRELCSILGSSRGNSRQSHHLGSSQAEAVFPTSSLSTSLSGSNGLSSSHKNKSVSVSLASLRSRGATPPSPGPGALVASGSREQRDVLRELMRSQGGTSRRATPENVPFPSRRPGSGRAPAPPTHHLPPVTPQRRRGRRKRCEQCSQRLGVATTYECRCGGLFCAQHRYAETHTCTFDYRTAGRNMIQMTNPLVAPNKLPKI